MPFDWDLLKPGREITDAQKKVVEDIALTFLDRGAGSPVHEKNKQLRGRREILSELDQFGFIRNHWNSYYPTFPALYFLPQSVREVYASYLHYTFKAIQVLFDSRGPGRYQIDEVAEQMKEVLMDGKAPELAQGGLDAIYFNRAVLFLKNFPQTVITEDSNKTDVFLGAIIPTHEMYEYDNLQKAWRLELKQNPLAYMKPLIPPPAVSGTDATEKKPEAVRDKARRVFVIHGRDERLRAGVFEFLRALHLQPLEWNTVIGLTGRASPYVGQILEAAFKHAQAVVVLLSPDDEARLRADLVRSDDPAFEKTLTGQARPNVLFEAGMALASHPDQTVLLQIGQVKPFSDVAGRHVVKMDGSIAKRQEFAIKLQTAGCPVNIEGTDWHKSGDLTASAQNITPPAVGGTARHQAAEAKPPISNLVSLKPLPSLRYVNVDESDTWREVGAKGDGVLGAIAMFRNEPIKGVSLRTIDGLTAQITFFDANGGELQRIHHGTWLGDPFNHTDLSHSETRELLIAVDQQGAPSPYAIENTRRRAVDYEETGSREQPLERRLYDVTVRLVGRAASDGDVSDDFHFNLDLRGEFPVLKLEWSRR